jgi:hypothetical protein
MAAPIMGMKDYAGLLPLNDGVTDDTDAAGDNR